MSSRHLMDAQTHMAQGYEHLDLATAARRDGLPGATFHAAMAAAHGTLASLELTAYAQAKNGVPLNDRVDRLAPGLPIPSEEVPRG